MSAPVSAPLSTGRLVVCPTPIGNLEDVTLRVLAALREADIVACEDTRRTRVLLDRYGVGGKLVSYHEHNERAARERAGGEDAGRRGRRFGLRCRNTAGVGPRVRPGAGVRRRRPGRRGAARAVCRAGGARRQRSAGRPVAVRRVPAAQALRARAGLRVTRDAGGVRVAQARGRLAQVLAELDPERPVAVARELTKIHEEVVRGTAGELAARYSEDPPRGEVALVVGGAPSVVDEIGPALDALKRLVEAGAKPRPAASVVSELTGVAANRLYRALTAE